MSPQQIEATIAQLNQSMASTGRPWVTTSGCTDPRCTTCGSKR